MQFEVERDILKPIVKVSVLKYANEDQNRFIIFPYKKIEDKHIIIPEQELKEKFPLTYKYFKSIKEILDKRDKGKKTLFRGILLEDRKDWILHLGKKILTPY